QREVKLHHVADEPGVVDEPPRVVLGRGRVRRGPLIPASSVDISVVHNMHPDTMPAARPEMRSQGEADVKRQAAWQPQTRSVGLDAHNPTKHHNESR